MDSLPFLPSTSSPLVLTLECIEPESQNLPLANITESFAMWPGSSVSGIYFAHPESRYFTLGKIDRDQVALERFGALSTATLVAATL